MGCEKKGLISWIIGCQVNQNGYFTQHRVIKEELNIEWMINIGCTIFDTAKAEFITDLC